MPPSTTFGALLRQVRKRAGMTQGDLAAAVGYSASFVCDMEQNRRLPAVEVVLQQFIPALGLQNEAALATRLVELAALARGERPPATLTLQRSTQLTVTETFTRSISRLPALPTELIGREQEVKTLCKRLQGHSGRLFTLTGPPGVGKTTLALAVASGLEALFKDGAHFVPLAAISDPELVATTIANELKLSDRGQQSPQERLIQGLRQQELLLVLDNFEQIVAAAPLLATLLAECPRLHLLVTSRERLHLRAEQRFPVAPLALVFAVDLFVKRAQTVDPTFEPLAATLLIIQEICQCLDCLPLAIELIAAHIDLFSPQSLLVRLQEHRFELLNDSAFDLPTRHRTLRQAIQHSYDLLAAREQRLFRTLGIFVGGFDLTAVAHFGFGLEVLHALLNKSLVQSAEHAVPSPASGGAERRFFLLETLRDYAYEQLVDSQEGAEVHRQHATYYLQWAETIEPHLRSSQATAAVAQLETEHNNLRAALAWALTLDNAETALRLSGALGPFWILHGHVREGKTWLAKALALRTDTPSVGQAKACMAAGSIAFMLGEIPAAQALFEQSLELYRALNDRQGVAWALWNLGDVVFSQHVYPAARAFYQQSLALYQALEDKAGLADIAICLGWLAINQGDNEQARTHFAQSLALRREQGEHEVPLTVLKGLAWLASQQQDYWQASARYAELLTRARELEDTAGIAQALNHLGRTALFQGELTQAMTYLTEGFRLAQELGYPSFLQFALDNQGNLAFAQGDYEAAAHYYTKSLGMACQIEDKFAIATLLERLAGILGAQQKAEQATRLLGAAAHLHEVIGAPLRAMEQPRYQQIVLAVRAQLNETTYASAYAAGYAMNPDQAVAFALTQFAAPQNATPQA